MNFPNIFYLIGYFILILSVAMIPAIGVGMAVEGPDALVFLGTALSGFFIAGLLILGNRSKEKSPIDVKDAFFLTGLVWLVSIIIGAVPLYFGSLGLTITDAIFQSTSMITTTGANLIPDLNFTSKSILLWCSTLQWLGGKGIITMAIMIMPILRVGGAQLLHTETSDKVEKFMPRVTQMVMIIFGVYTVLTVLCAGILWALGFSFFNAVCHALTTLSTGGFSTWEKSIQHAGSLSVQAVITLFMYLGGTTFFVLALIVKTGPKVFWRDVQIRTYTKIILLVTIVVALWRFYNSETGFGPLVIESLFNVTSAITATGYVSADYSLWGGLALIIFFFLPFIGGCTGSTAGGIKVFRFQILWKAAITQLKKMRRPHGVFTVTYGGKPISDTVLLSVTSFFFLYALTFVVLALSLGLLNLDFLTAVSGAASALTNLGPGLGDIIGPTGSYEGLPSLAKWILAVGMLLGRIELVALLVMVMPSFWKR